MSILIPNPVIVLGASAGTSVTIKNCRSLMYDPIGIPQPRFVMNTTVPVDWHKPHKYVRGGLDVLGEAYDAFFNNNGTAYIHNDGNNQIIPYFVATMTDEDGNTWTYTFADLFPVGDAGNFVVNKEVVRVYPFVAKYVTIKKTSS